MKGKMALAVGLICAGGLVLTACSDTSATEPAVIEQKIIEEKSVEAPVRDPAMQQLVDQAGLNPCPVGVENPDAAIPGLPNIELPCLGDGPPVNLSTLRGIPLVVNVWASWCPPCIEEMPILAQAARELEGTVQFIGIDYQDDPARGLELLTDMGVDFPSVFDPDAQVRAPLAIPGPPVTYFVTPEGVIAGRWDGSITSEQALATLIETYLGVTW
jgi:cytochrome c biogenesis protein CcmG, thiol:disulfide interchange protein DsbE